MLELVLCNALHVISWTQTIDREIAKHLPPHFPVVNRQFEAQYVQQVDIPISDGTPNGSPSTDKKIVFHDENFAKLIGSIVKKEYDLLTEHDLSIVDEIRSDQPIPLDDLEKLHDYTHVSIGKSGQPHFLEGAVIDHEFIPGTLTVNELGQKNFTQGMHIENLFIAGLFSKQLDEVLFIPGVQHGTEFIPGLAMLKRFGFDNDTFIPGVLSDFSTERNIFQHFLSGMEDSSVAQIFLDGRSQMAFVPGRHTATGRFQAGDYRFDYSGSWYEGIGAVWHDRTEYPFLEDDRTIWDPASFVMTGTSISRKKCHPKSEKTYMDNAMDKSSKGSTIGGAIGAGIGAIIGKTGYIAALRGVLNGALQGSAVGAILGSVIGLTWAAKSYYDDNNAHQECEVTITRKTSDNKSIEVTIVTKQGESVKEQNGNVIVTDKDGKETKVDLQEKSKDDDKKDDRKDDKKDDKKDEDPSMHSSTPKDDPDPTEEELNEMDPDGSIRRSLARTERVVKTYNDLVTDPTPDDFGTDFSAFLLRPIYSKNDLVTDPSPEQISEPPMIITREMIEVWRQQEIDKCSNPTQKMSLARQPVWGF